MPLSDLPKEIILDIADQLDDAGMNALAHTNSGIYQFLSKYLYRRDVTRPRGRSLTWAIVYGLEATLQRAVDAGKHLDPILESFHIALQDSAARGDANLVAALLNLDGINPNFDGGGRSPPLVPAARRGHSAVVELLLAVSNIDPNVRGRHDATPLSCACRGGHVSVVRQLLAREDIDPNAVVCEGMKTPLLEAVESGNIVIVNLLLSKDGIDVNLRPEFNNIAPLMMAIQLGSIEVVESLLARDDLDLNIVDDDGYHVLLNVMKARLGLDKVKLLLDRNVDPDLVGAHGTTAFMIACSLDDKQDLDLIEFLLDQGIDGNRQDAFGRTAFHHAVISGCSKVVEFLLDRDDIDPNIPDTHGETPLFDAVWRGEFSVADLILRKTGIDVNARDDGGSTLLGRACTRTSHQADDDTVDFVDSLLSHHGADPNIVDNDGVSILSRVLESERVSEPYRTRIGSLLQAAGAR
jgi:ankyrin repeat protein